MKINNDNITQEATLNHNQLELIRRSILTDMGTELEFKRSANNATRRVMRLRVR